MQLKAMVKLIIRNLDQLSPYPLFYPFIMSSDEKVFYEEVIKESYHYLEFGLGGSTLRAIQKSKARIYAVESSPEWINHMRKYLVLRYYENKRLFIFPVNIGPTRGWGLPETDNDQNLFEAYSSRIFDLIDINLIDLALVDGRFRVACTLKIIELCHAKTNMKILIHDFWNREQYHILLKYLDVMKKADTMGLFTIKNDIDIESVKIDYEAYKLNPQ